MRHRAVQVEYAVNEEPNWPLSVGLLVIGVVLFNWPLVCAAAQWWRDRGKRR